MIQTERSQADWQAFRALEARRHHEFFMPYYPKLGMEVVRDIFDDTKTNDYDVVVKYKGGIYRVDEKARTREYDDFAVEVMQCVRTGRIGWIYKDVHYIFYASWKNPEDTDPSSAYLIDRLMLRDFIVENLERLPGFVSTKGYGESWNKKVSWQDLLYLEVAEKII